MFHTIYFVRKQDTVALCFIYFVRKQDTVAICFIQYILLGNRIQ